MKIRCLFAAALACLIFLSGCSSYGPKLSEQAYGDLTLTLYGNENRIRHIKVTRGENVISDFNTDGGEFTMTDLNFDGLDDIRLLRNGSTEYYDCYLRVSADGGFAANAVLGGLRRPVWDETSRTVTSEIHTVAVYPKLRDDEPDDTVETRGTAVWEFRDGKPVQISETGLTYYTETNNFRWYLMEADENGELTYTFERWLSEKDLEKHNLTWEF